MMTFADFMSVIARMPRGQGAIPGTLEEIRTVRGPKNFEDDVSIVEVTF
jgi:hypothetical protein